MDLVAAPGGRKLVPTNPERMVWGQGDGSGLRVVPTSLGRLGGLICWDNHVPLARYALSPRGSRSTFASTWDGGDTWISSMRRCTTLDVAGHYGRPDIFLLTVDRDPRMPVNPTRHGQPLGRTPGPPDGSPQRGGP